MGRTTEKEWAKRPSDHQLQEAEKKKDSDRTLTPEAEAVHVPAHLVLPGSPQAKQMHHLHAQLSLEESCHRQKCLAPVHTGLLWWYPTLCDPVDCGMPDFFVRRVLQARILERTGQYLFPYLSRVLYFLLPYLLSPLRTWCCQNPCNPSSCTNSTPGPHRDKPKFSREVSGANPSGPPKCRGGTNTTIET